jgi:exodeoxyribonuclease V alpha subunit
VTEAVVVENVLSAGRFGGAIFGALRADGSRVRIVADQQVMPQPPIAGEIWAITGRWQKHPGFGLQVIASEAQRERPSGRLIIQHLEKSPAYPGIGRARATALWQRFGTALYELLDAGAVGDLAEVVGDDLGRIIVEAWRSEKALGPVLKWLDLHGFPVWFARKIVAIWGVDAEQKLTENPYRMLAFAPWTPTDRAGLTIGVAPDDERRLVAAVEACCYQRLALGHTRVKGQELPLLVCQLLECDAGLAARAVAAAVADHAIVEQDDGWQPSGPWAMERFVSREIKAMAAGARVAAQPALIRPVAAEELETALHAFELRQGYRLNREQRKAVLTALTSPVSVICGGAGVGKTTTLKAIYEAFEAIGGTTHQMALSGRAAMRMQEATERPARTIAGFLKGVREGEIDLGLDPLVVIDEASMLDLPTMCRILRWLQPGCRLLLVGDPGQLPPIGFGIAFHALAQSDDVPRVELTEVHRQAAATGIPDAAATVRNGRVPVLGGFEGLRPGLSFVQAAPHEIAGHLVDIVDALGGFREVQIVGATKGGPAGIRALNQTFHDLLTPGRASHLGYGVGEPVIWLVNDWEAGLLNGSLGVVEGGDEQSLALSFDGTSAVIGPERLTDLALAYAITTHKAQGSQFRRVIVPVVQSRLLDRTLLYTAITRAQEQVVLIGDRAAFAEAITAPAHVSRREVGIDAHLRSATADGD